MRKITICDECGFCRGVKRAIQISEQTAEENRGRRCCTLGPIVHNRKVVENLEGKGIKCASSPDEAGTGILIIRSHGVAPSVIREAEEKGLEIIDATCVFVKKIHKIVTRLSEQGIPAIIIGKKDHPEVQGITGYAHSGFFVVNSVKEAEELPFIRKAGIVIQTTKTKEEYDSILAELQKRIPETESYNTICFETLERQKKTAELASKSDVIIAAGGKHSSNTSKLCEIASKYCKRVYLAEDASEVRKEWIEGAENIGLVCGASTPIEELEKIKSKIEEF